MSHYVPGCKEKNSDFVSACYDKPLSRNLESSIEIFASYMLLADTNSSKIDIQKIQEQSTIQVN